MRLRRHLLASIPAVFFGFAFGQSASPPTGDQSDPSTVSKEKPADLPVEAPADTPSPLNAPARTQGGTWGVKTSIRLASKDVFSAHNKTVCLLGGLPSEARYVTIGWIKASKGTYGQVEEVMRAMAEQGRRYGADAIVGLQSKQHVNVFLPWRVTRPIGEGMLIKLQDDSPKLNCAGGHLY